MTHGERQSRNMWDAWREFRERDMGAKALANKPEYTKPSDFWFWVCGLEPLGGIAADFVLWARDLVTLGYNPEAQVDKLSQEDRIQLQRLRWQWKRKLCAFPATG